MLKEVDYYMQLDGLTPPDDESATPIIFMVKALFLQPISMGCLPMHLFFKAFNKPQQLDIQTMLVVIGYQAIQARSMQMK